MDTLHFSQEIPIRHRAGICVVGAGPAGCAAATVAAEQGADVLLIESGAMCGGMSTAGRVPVFMPWSDGIRILCEGYGRRILQALKEEGKRHDFETGCSIHAEHLKRIYEQFLEEAGAHLLYYSRLAAVRQEEGRVRQAVFAAPGGMFAVEAEVFVDATGDGTLAAWAGAPFERGDEHGHVMPSTLCSVWTGFDWDAYRRGGIFSHNDERMPALLEEAFHSGLLPEEDIQVLIDLIVSRGGMVKNLHGQKNLYYQVNATYYSALGESDDKMLLARAIQMFMPGKPQIWYLDLFAGKNDHEAVLRAGESGHKEINRTNLSNEDIVSGLQKDIVRKQLELIRMRNTWSVFSENAKVEVYCEGALLTIGWELGEAFARLRVDFDSGRYTIESNERTIA